MPAPLTFRQRTRAWLVLTRGSNLPTVWSNCLAGWWLGGGGDVSPLPALIFGASALYTAGMFFNDFCDADFDAKFRPERPIPAGLLRQRTVAWAGLAATGVGAACLCPLSPTTAVLAVALISLILAYDGLHKRIVHGPLLMAGCRFLLYLVAASTAACGIGPAALIGAVGLAAYVAGLSYLAHGESLPELPSRWSWLPLATPLALLLLPRSPVPWDAWRALTYGGPLAFCLWRAWHKACHLGVRASIADLLACIPLVDLALAAPLPFGVVLAFTSLFAAARLFQRLIPAT